MSHIELANANYDCNFNLGYRPTSIPEQFEAYSFSETVNFLEITLRNITVKCGSQYFLFCHRRRF